MTNTAPPRKSLPRRVVRFILRWTFRLAAAIIVVALVIFLVVFRTALYNRFVHFPKQAAAWAALAQQRREVPPPQGWQEFRGVFHSHSHFSHDSEVEFADILAAAHDAKIDFIFMSDHCVDGKADYSLQWRGLHDGVLFAPGFEMQHGLMPWALPSSTVLECGKDPELLAQDIETAGGLLFFAHSEEERLWDLPQLTGMEIYNINTDFKDESGYGAVMPDILLSLRTYPDHVLRQVFDRQDDILAQWDELNRHRRIVGIAASDAHQNNGFRGYYTSDGNLLLRMTSPDDIDTLRLNVITRGLLRMAFGPLEPGKQLFRVDLDRYARSLRFVNTHVLAKELSEAALLDNLKHGRAFIAFDMLADASGFSVTAHNADAVAVIGDSLPLTPETELRIASPLPCRVTITHDGNHVAQMEGLDLAYRVETTGKYRVEAELMILDTWTPWVYTNPIEIVGTAAVAAP